MNHNKKHIKLYNERFQMESHEDVLQQRDMSLISHLDRLNKRLAKMSHRRGRKAHERMIMDFLASDLITIEQIPDVSDIIEHDDSLD